MIRHLVWLAPLVVMFAACSSADSGDDPTEALSLVAVTFNSGTTEGMVQDPPVGGYTPTLAGYSDQYYGDGLAWLPAVAAAREFFDSVDPDLVVFQEIFHADECAQIPVEAQEGFYCANWSPGDPTVALAILGDDWQVACHLGKPDKCAAVNRRFGTFRGCQADLCLDGLDGSRVPDCGSGSRVGRGVIELVAGGELTLVNYHGSSGFETKDQNCRAAQVDQVFVDIGDGQAGANGALNLVMGDLNTDPARLPFDPSAQRWNDFVGDGKAFHWLTELGEDAPRTYANLLTIDHVISDVLVGSCWHAGVTAGHPDVIDTPYFDHKPVVCELREPGP